MFIQTEDTPNPNVVMFTPDRLVSAEGPLDYPNEEAAAASPLARALFAIDGVAGVFFGAAAVSVTRLAEGPSWAEMKPAVLTAIMDHFASGAPLVDVVAVEAAAAEDDSEIVAEIKALLDSRIRPAVAQDGGDILFDRFEEATGTLYLQMRGACAGCPSSSATLKAGVEQMMRHYVPEVERVEQTL
ncbi:MAG TPA: NifU family protein [Brevundimonas sp.]|uniref:NifU family protein n=1 Tax=Brevundimonas sp. TaxID=1871086 RepID=UPI0026341585|nr:NifU family protein [Brevundimonas sp.]HRO33756.1 NifU family protein [Brevundimonas sp.]